MFKNRRSTVVAKKPSELATIRESQSSDLAIGPSQPKVRRPDEPAPSPVSIAETENVPEEFGSSQFSVPASQMNSQRRYLSQRNNLQKSQSARTSRRVPTNYFESILLKCLVDLDDPNMILLKCEPINFVRKLRVMLQSSPDHPRNVKDFINGVQQASRSKESFRKMLECCSFQNQTTGDVKPVQESLMKMLLCVDFLQLELITVLFDCVERCVSEDNDSGMNMIGLVLSQLKFVDHTLHGKLVFDRYFKVLERSKDVRLLQETVASLEDVIDVAQQDAAFRRILELFPRPADLFTSTNVTVFSELCLSGSSLRIARQKVVDFVEMGCPFAIYPAMVKFLLKFNYSEVEGLQENIGEIRQVVAKLIQLWEDGTSERCIQEIFQIVYQALTVSAVLYESWIKFSRLLTDEDSHMGLDLLVLLLMISVNEMKAGSIQKILINKIRKNHLNMSHWKEAVQYYRCVMQQHMDCVLDFVESCLKERQPEVCGFGVEAMVYLFGTDGMNNRMVLNKLVGFMCETALVNGTGTSNEFLIEICMNALASIQERRPEDLRNNAHILLKIMDISPDLSLIQYRSAVELICEAIEVPGEPSGDCENWDSLNIIIRKQLLSTNKDVKKKGVIGVVRLIRYLLRNSSGSAEITCSFDSEKTIESATDIPTAAGREIGNMINLMLTSSNESTDILALCYDELAEMLQGFEKSFGKPEKAFTIWLCDTLTNDFQSYFIVEELSKGNVIQFAKKLCINETSDVEESNAEAYAIAVNIADNMLAYNSRFSSMCFFLSMFKLMKTLQLIRYDGNLESINALLGCAIIVPSFYNEPDEKNLVETYEENVCRQVLDAYFYTANWFRELINAFLLQTDPLLHRKVLLRLSELVSLETRLAALLRTIDFDYYPPVCDFSTDPVQTSKAGRPAKESNSKSNITLNPTARTQLDTTRKAGQAEGLEFGTDTLFSKHHRGFRVMEKTLIQLFREPMDFCHKLPENELGVRIGLAEYRFLLETVTVELETRQAGKTKLRYNYELKDLLQVLPSTVDKFCSIKSKRRELFDTSGSADILDFKALGCCFDWTLRLFSALLFLIKRDAPKLLDKTFEIIGKISSVSNQDSDQLLTSELTHKNAFKDLTTAYYLFKFGLTLNNISSTSEGSNQIATFCQNFLCSNFLSKSGNATHLAALLQGLFVSVDFQKIKRLTKALADDLAASKTDDRIFAGLQRSHYALLFRELTKAFIRCIQAEIRSKKTSTQKFILWEQSCEILKQFSDVVKQADSPKFYSCYMKNSHTYLKLFQQSGLRALEDVLKVSADRVSHLLSTLQHSTRYLHNICCHSKQIKDGALAVQIPFLRETVETLIYSVKAVLAANGCASVFWMGNLKNKDLHGVLIVTQERQTEEEEAEESTAESDIADFLSDDEAEGTTTTTGRRRDAVPLRKSTSNEKSSQSKCF
ncbi:Fanconi anemia group D2 protein homolog [Uranotaenia lowii]|uniref:Fanconi anemia group D2 protein homolog n=1 Tax=Uranotaenia lowii TaxID=190385 RepID=UPI0024794A50|nr:Fanconi anemia group D2 protein homolog [Uranotaenia lowii]